jgi:hypothetical protein
VLTKDCSSGLDSQSSWSIVAFLRKLADNGQAVLSTIHQPSAILFQEFDRLLFLAKGGKTVYFGDVGKNSKILLDYFETAGARRCDDEENPAEYMLEIGELPFLLRSSALASSTTCESALSKSYPGTRLDRMVASCCLTRRATQVTPELPFSNSSGVSRTYANNLSSGRRLAQGPSRLAVGLERFRRSQRSPKRTRSHTRRKETRRSSRTWQLSNGVCYAHHCPDQACHHSSLSAVLADTIIHIRQVYSGYRIGAVHWIFILPPELQLDRPPEYAVRNIYVDVE